MHSMQSAQQHVTPAAELINVLRQPSQGDRMMVLNMLAPADQSPSRVSVWIVLLHVSKTCGDKHGIDTVQVSNPRTSYSCRF